MGKAVEFREVQIELLKPYEQNAKKHPENQIRKLGESIRRRGFISPCLIDKDMNVIAGHGRIMAAKEIGLELVPCVFIEGLTDEERRAYILEDNRLAEMSDWDMEAVAEELADLHVAGIDMSGLDFEIDIPEEMEIEFEEGQNTQGEPEEKGKPWKTRGMKCDMKPCIAARVKNGHRYVSLYAASKEGQTLEEIKNSKKCERKIAEELIAQIREQLGKNLAKNGWAMITTGRRRHREGYHFATEVTRRASEALGLRFYEGAIECGNADRLKPALEIRKEPEERNLILFDDVITTGTTMTKTVELLEEHGYTVLVIIGIRNQ